MSCDHDFANANLMKIIECWVGRAEAAAEMAWRYVDEVERWVSCASKEADFRPTREEWHSAEAAAKKAETSRKAAQNALTTAKSDPSKLEAMEHIARVGMLDAEFCALKAGEASLDVRGEALEALEEQGNLCTISHVVIGASACEWPCEFYKEEKK